MTHYQTPSPAKEICQFVQNDQLRWLLERGEPLTLADKKHWTALISLDGVGPLTFYNILNYLKKTRTGWSEFWGNRGGVWQKMMLNERIVKSIQKFNNEYTINSYWQGLRREQLSVVAIAESTYPFLLKLIADPPPILFVKGQIGLCSQLPIAVIGTRKMTPYGRLVTDRLVRELVVNGATIISGFMYGVDVRAQQQALSYRGYTVGVVGYGFDHVFPVSHAPLMKQMLTTNRVVFISEFAPHTQPNRGTFPRRNRLIAGLSLGVVVTEAGPKSGTQITVDCALDCGRDVFAVSGPITSPYHEGVKQMLNQGAMLVSSGLEVLNNLSARNWSRGDLTRISRQVNDQKTPDDDLVASAPAALTPRLSLVQQVVLKTLRTLPLSAAQVAEHLELELLTAHSVLTELELLGAVRCEANRWWLARQ